MRPVEYPEKRVSTALRLPPALHAAIKAAAAERDVSANWLIERLLTDGMAHLVPVADLRVVMREAPDE